MLSRGFCVPTDQRKKRLGDRDRRQFARFEEGMIVGGSIIA